jgi:membrane fusion protein (multidrug efflux system)
MPDGTVTGTLDQVRAPGLFSVRRLLLAAGPVAVVVAGTALYSTGGRYVSTDNAYVQADIVPISTDVSGIVRTVEVHDDEHVKAGQVLFRLDDQSFRYAVENAAAALASAKSDVAALRADWRAKQQEVKLAEIEADFAKREWQRRSDLFRQHVAPQSAMDQAQQALDAAESKLAATHQESASVAAHLADEVDQPIEDYPRVRAAQAQLDQARLNLDHAIVRAPADGVLTNVPNLQVGRYLMASAAAFSLVIDNSAWIEANPKETQLTWVKPGQKVTVSVDTYPGVTWGCIVGSLAPASRSQFALLPAQNTSGNWVKVVQRIPLRVACPAAPDKPAMRAGMSADIEIDTEHHRTLAELLGSVGF